jgi:hypothetical protein
MQLIVNVFGFAVLIGTAALLAWYKAAGSARPPGSSVPATPSE